MRREGICKSSHIEISRHGNAVILHLVHTPHTEMLQVSPSSKNLFALSSGTLEIELLISMRHVKVIPQRTSILWKVEKAGRHYRRHLYPPVHANEYRCQPDCQPSFRWQHTNSEFINSKAAENFNSSRSSQCFHCLRHVPTEVFPLSDPDGKTRSVPKVSSIAKCKLSNRPLSFRMYIATYSGSWQRAG